MAKNVCIREEFRALREFTMIESKLNCKVKNADVGFLCDKTVNSCLAQGQDKM
jgi:hypothetical protein